MQKTLLEQVVALCHQAGAAILEVYHAEQAIKVDTKADNSPVTKADLAAHYILAPALEKLLPNVPVLSEEGEIPSYAIRQQWARYWIIDPLDGTKEFINRNGEFTVNVALIEHGEAILGAVHVPITGVTYTGVRDTTSGESHAQKITGNIAESIRVRTIESRQLKQQPISVVASRNHNSPAVDTLLKSMERSLGDVNTTSMGSSLKLCLIAEGAADFYPRLAPTCEWDTAAAQAVVEAAGGIVLDDQLKPLRYNQKEDLLNPYFYVIGDRSFSWADFLSN